MLWVGKIKKCQQICILFHLSAESAIMSKIKTKRRNANFLQNKKKFLWSQLINKVINAYDVLIQNKKAGRPTAQRKTWRAYWMAAITVLNFDFPHKKSLCMQQLLRFPVKDFLSYHILLPCQKFTFLPKVYKMLSLSTTTPVITMVQIPTLMMMTWWLE